MKINIAYCPDDKYINQTVVSIISALENNIENEVEIIILYSKLSVISIEKLKEVENSYQNMKLRLLEIDEKIFSELPLSHWVTVQAWFRILLPTLCDDLDKVLYLDCDTLVAGNLSELFSMDLNNKFFAGVKDVWGVNKYVKRLGMKSDVYVNSGMLLFNCDYCRKENFFDKIVDFAKNNSKIIEFCDQDSINKVADEKKLVVSPKYNFMDTWWRGGYYELEGNEETEYLKAKDKPIIIHLTGLKPAFKGCGNKFKDLWWKYAQKSSIYEEIKKDYENSKPPKEAFYKNIFNIKNEYKGKIKSKVLIICGLKIKLR